MRVLTVVLATALVLAGPAAAAALEVTFLANEGFLLRAGEQGVIIDGLLERTTYGGMYGALSPEVYEAAMAGEPPFTSVDVLLASHEHEDHFQASATKRFLAAHPEALLVSSPQVAQRLESDRASGIWPEPGEFLERRINGVQVEFVALGHGSGRFASVQNLGHVIHIGGYAVLHIGDAAMEVFNFASAGFGQRNFDVAILPYWYFQDPAGQAIIRGQINATHLIAAHVPPQEFNAVRDYLDKEWPDVLLLKEALDSRNY